MPPGRNPGTIVRDVVRRAPPRPLPDGAQDHPRSRLGRGAHGAARAEARTGVMPEFRDLVEGVGRGVDAAGVLVIAAGLVLVTLAALPTLRSEPSDAAYAAYRRGVGKVILLGLELLVAADIIRTVAVQPTLAGVAVLGVIVLVRTFLSFSLEVELYGRWPWTRAAAGTSEELPPQTAM